MVYIGTLNCGCGQSQILEQIAKNHKGHDNAEHPVIFRRQQTSKHHDGANMQNKPYALRSNGGNTSLQGTPGQIRGWVLVLKRKVGHPHL